MTIFSFDRDSLRSALERVFAAEKSNGSLVQLVFLDVKLVMDQVLVFWREVGGEQIWGTFVDPTEVLTTMKDEPDLSRFASRVFDAVAEPSESYVVDGSEWAEGVDGRRPIFWRGIESFETSVTGNAHPVAREAPEMKAGEIARSWTPIQLPRRSGE